MKTKILKNNLLFLMVLAILVFDLSAFGTNNSRESLAKYISKDIYNHAETKKIFDFNTDTTKIKIQDAKNLRQLIFALVDCLTAKGAEALCGAHPEPQEAYFDDQGTTAHLYLLRSLEFGIASKIDLEDAIESAIKVKATKIQAFALENVGDLNANKWGALESQILDENRILFYLKVLGSKNSGKQLEVRIRKQFHEAIAKNLFYAEQLTQLRQHFSKAQITAKDLKFVCSNAEKNDILFVSIKKRLEIGDLCKL